MSARLAEVRETFRDPYCIESFLKAYLCSQGAVRQGKQEAAVLALKSDVGDRVPPNLRGAATSFDSFLGEGENATQEQLHA